MQRMGIGVQLYTLRDNMAADLPGTLRQVAALGYEGVEFAGYFGRSAEELRALADEYGLKVIGAHVGLANLRNNLLGEIEFMKTLGGSYIVCPGVPLEERNTVEGWKKLFAFFRETGEEVRKHGLQFGYHNHAFEFDLQVDGAYAFDALYASAAPDAIQVEMDVCWVQAAGQDPLAYIRRYANRLPLLHLKDFSRNEDGSMKTLELGQGVVDLPGVIAASGEAGVKWLIVEQDNCQNPPLASIENSLNWLKQHYPVAEGAN
ncbi:sugar phosphate isomerase/epimerase family protein [Paenibacillus cymbidii]|uniref:sugar phosphate isomerase/epimerase family protein n=1 Tax=Paenibacillus cymbidii TaxID=1639034 RepID=UPI0010806787|nr:sugar phosphate isomerase/epimerase [Paenibacillus cymbidii]